MDAYLHVAVRVDRRLPPGNTAAGRRASNSRTGTPSLKPFQSAGVAPFLVLVRQRDRLAVDVLDGRDAPRDRVRPGAHRDRQRHRAQHVRRVVLAVQRLVADHRPAGGAHDVHVQAVAGVEAHRRRHDDRRRTGDADEADLEILLLRRGSGLCGRLGHHILRAEDRKGLVHGGRDHAGAQCADDAPAPGLTAERGPFSRHAHRGAAERLDAVAAQVRAAATAGRWVSDQWRYPVRLAPWSKPCASLLRLDSSRHTDRSVAYKTGACHWNKQLSRNDVAGAGTQGRDRLNRTVPEHMPCSRPSACRTDPAG